MRCGWCFAHSRPTACDGTIRRPDLLFFLAEETDSIVQSARPQVMTIATIELQPWLEAIVLSLFSGAGFAEQNPSFLRRRSEGIEEFN